MDVLTNNYLLRANIAICKATIIPIEATIGKSKEFSCMEDSSILFTDEEIDVTLESIFSPALSRVEPKPSISDFNLSSSPEVSSKIEFNLTICSATPLISWLKTDVAAEPGEMVPLLNATM